MESSKLGNTIENKERIKVETKILSIDELREIIYKGTSFPQDTRFLATEEGGVFKYFSPRNIISINRFPSRRIFPVVYEANKIVGLSELERDPENDKNFWIQFVSIDPEHQGKGYASGLLKQIFQFAKDGGYTLEPSLYSEQGLEKLKNVIEKLSFETGVGLVGRHK